MASTMTNVENQEKVLWDVKSQTPLPHFTFILHQFLPIRHCKQEDVETEEKQIMDVYQQIYGDSPDMKVIFTGSSFEGLYIPSYFFVDPNNKEPNVLGASDVDVMIELSTKVTSDNRREITTVCPSIHSYIETGKPDIHPGYLRLILARPELTDEIYKIAVPNKPDFYLMSNALTSSGIEECIQRISIDDPGFLSSHKLENHGPAITYFSTKEISFGTKIDQTRETDHVMSVPCHEWPQAAIEWTTRDRPSGWPSSTLVNDVTKYGCHVVPVGHTNSDWKAVEWRFSFSIAEKILVHSLNDVQRHCYKLIKILHEFALQEPKVICSYHLKTVLLRTCEQAVGFSWTEDNMASGLLYLLDEVWKALSSRKLCHYFITENNLIDHIPEKTIVSFLARFEEVRRDPLKYVFAFNKKYKFGFSPLSLPLETILEPMVQEIENQKHTMQPRKDLSELKVSCYEILAYIHQKENRIGEIIVTWCQIFQELVLKGLVPLEVPLVDYLFFRLGKLSDSSFVLMQRVADLVLEKFDVPPRILSNHACLLFSRACNKEDKEEKEMLIGKADSAFLQAVTFQKSRKECITAMWTDYSNFLCKLEKYNIAIPFLQEVLERDERTTTPTGQNTYSKSDAKAVTEHVQNEIEAMDQPFTVSSVAYAFYLLIYANVELNNKSENEQLIRRFESHYKQLTKPDTATKTLLGYSLMIVEDYKSALSIFEELGDHPTASTNRDECQAYILSLEPCE